MRGVAVVVASLIVVSVACGDDDSAGTRPATSVPTTTSIGVISTTNATTPSPTEPPAAAPIEPPPPEALTDRPGHVTVDGQPGYADYLYRSFLQIPVGMAWGPDGHLYVADWTGKHVVRVAPDGTMEDLELWRSVPFLHGDGPRFIAFNSQGDMFVSNNGVIFWVDPMGQAAVVKESRSPLGGIAISHDDVLYFADRGAGDVWRLEGPESIELVASGVSGAESMAFGQDGTLYVAQTMKNRVVSVDVSTGKVSEFASGTFGNDPIFVAIDPEGDVWVRGISSLYQFNPDGTQKSYTVDGNSDMERRSLWHTAAGIAFDDEGGLWVGSYNSQLRYFAPAGDPDTHDDFESTPQISGFESSDLALGPDGEIYSSDINGQKIWRFEPDGSAKVILEGGSRGRTAVAVDVEGNLFAGFPWGVIATVDGEGNATDYASLLTRRMVFGGDGALYAAVGDYGQPKAILRITGPETFTVIAESVAGTPLGNGDVHLSPAGDDGLYALTEQDRNLYRIGFDGHGELVKSLPMGGGPAIMAASPTTGEVFYISHGPYEVIGVTGEQTRKIATHVWGDPWGMVVSADGEWLYVAESGAIDRIPLATP
jgi:sugar lactone lactonase YvrE